MRLMLSVVAVVLVSFSSLAIVAQGPGSVVRSAERFTMRVVTTGLAAPWEITWGPDQHLWVTERVGKRIVRVNPSSGQRTVLLTMPEVFQSVAQDGLLGLALHPDFLRGAGSDYVYVAFTSDAAPGPETLVRLTVRRYRYDQAKAVLVDPLPVLTALPAHDDHLGGRLIVGPDRKLYLSIGDQGGNWLKNRCRPNRAQELPTAADVSSKRWAAYEGKILRVDLDGAVPSDNPVINGVRSHVLSYGHRNPLGLSFGPGGQLYNSEHGPDTDDEVNLVLAGRNYGWPMVAGFRDDRGYAYADWSSGTEPCASFSLPTESAPPVSVPRQRETAWSHPQFAGPLRTFFTTDTPTNPPRLGADTIAPGGIDVHLSGRGVPGWNDSLLVLSMVRGVVYRVPLASKGHAVEEPVVEVLKTTNRYRDIAVHPDQRVFYIATDPAGLTADDAGAPTTVLANPGSILEFTYTP